MNDAMNELYMWATAIVVGFILLKVIPAAKLSRANKKMREKIPGLALIIMYFVIGILIWFGIYVLLSLLNVNEIVRYVISGAIIGAFVGLIPLVDKKNSGDNSNDNPRGL